MKTLIKTLFLTILFFSCQSDPKPPSTSAVPSAPTASPPPPSAATKTPPTAAATKPASKPKKQTPLCEREAKAHIAQGLVDYLGAELDKIPASQRYFAFAEFDLNRDGQNEYFVALTAPHFCGSGGCSALILNSDFTVHSNFTVLDFPVYVSSIFLTDGWYDLFLKSGDTHHRIKLDRKKYPSNPSVEPEMDMAFYPEKTSLMSYAYILKCRY